MAHTRHDPTSANRHITQRRHPTHGNQLTVLDNIRQYEANEVERTMREHLYRALSHLMSTERTPIIEAVLPPPIQTKGNTKGGGGSDPYSSEP